jgi:hypothetical protein
MPTVQVDEFSMTHELIANILGVRREGITKSAGKLREAGLIRYGRGRISAIDRRGLEQRTCECYSVIQGEYGRLLPGRAARPPLITSTRTWHLAPGPIAARARIGNKLHITAGALRQL